MYGRARHQNCSLALTAHILFLCIQAPSESAQSEANTQNIHGKREDESVSTVLEDWLDEGNYGPSESALAKLQ